MHLHSRRALDEIEQKFDYEKVPTASVERIRDLQQRVRRMEGIGVADELTLLPGLAEVMTVRTGTACCVDAPGLALTLAAGASQNGTWVGFAGLPEVGWEAASGLGLDLERTVAVPFPGEHWLSVTAALIDVVGVVIARPPGRVSEAQAGRISARLRQRGAVLIVDGSWPRAALRLSTLENHWSGLGSGHGHLQQRRLRVEVRQPAAAPRRVSLGFGDSGSALTVLSDSARDLAPVTALVG